MMGSSDVTGPAAAGAVRGYWEWYIENTPVAGHAQGSAGYFDAIASGHQRAYGSVDALLDLGSLENERLLELGCGIGLDTVQFARAGARVTAVDLSPLALRLAQANLDRQGLRAELAQGNVEDLAYPDGSFDVIVARGLLMFTPDDERVVEQVHRLLAPGGRAQFLFHNRRSWYAAIGRLGRQNLVHPERDPPINRLYTEAQVRRLLAPFAGTTISYGRYPTATARPGRASVLFNRWLVPAFNVLPDRLVRPFGYYIIAEARAA